MPLKGPPSSKDETRHTTSTTDLRLRDQQDGSEHQHDTDYHSCEEFSTSVDEKDTTENEVYFKTVRMTTADDTETTQEKLSSAFSNLKESESLTEFSDIDSHSNANDVDSDADLYNEVLERIGDTNGILVNNTHSSDNKNENNTNESSQATHPLLNKKDKVINNRNSSVESNSKELEGRTTDNKHHSHLPIDRGWAWVIMFAMFSICFLLAGFWQTSSILFLEFLTIFEAAAATATLTFGLLTSVSGVGNVVVAKFLLPKFGARKLVMIGAFFNFASTAAASFSPNIVFLIISHCFIGFAHSLIYISAMALVSNYFNRRRALALALANTGGSVASFLFPILINTLHSWYGTRGTLLIMSAIYLNMMCAGGLLRPLESYSRQSQTQKPMKVRLLSSEDVSNLVKSSSGHLRNKVLRWDSWSSEIEVRFGEKRNEMYRRPRVASDASVLSSTLSDRMAFLQTDKLIACTVLDSTNKPLIMHQTAIISTEFLYEEDESEATSNEIVDKPDQDKSDAIKNDDDVNTSGKIDETEVNESVFKNRLFYFLLLFLPMANLTGFIAFFFPSLAIYNGLSGPESAHLLTIIGAVDLVSKISIGYIADLRIIKPTRMVIISLVIISIMCHLARFFLNFESLAAFAAVVGMFGAVGSSLLPVIIIEFVGLPAFTETLGIVLMANAICSSLTHPIIGALVDISGSFIIPFHYLGACLLLSAIILSLEPVIRKLEAKRKKRLLAVGASPELSA